MSVDDLPVYDLSVDDLPVYDLSVDVLSVDGLSIHDMSADDPSVDHLSVRREICSEIGVGCTCTRSVAHVWWLKAVAHWVQTVGRSLPTHVYLLGEACLRWEKQGFRARGFIRAPLFWRSLLRARIVECTRASVFKPTNTLSVAREPAQ